MQKAEEAIQTKLIYFGSWTCQPSLKQIDQLPLREREDKEETVTKI
jgi:hypothetical protein